MMRSPLDVECRELLEASPSRPSRHCLRSALHHLECAQKIVEIDKAMAAFRALTAEEEAATGIMHCLKERGYKNAELLKIKNHVHKNAISPFLDVLGLFFAETINAHVNKPGLEMHGEGAERRLMIYIPVQQGEENQALFPIPPLNFLIRGTDGKSPSFRTQIDTLVAHRGAKDILKHLQNLANERNKLLYAGPDGYPIEVDIGPTFFELRRVRVIALIRAYLLIQPYVEKLTFVQDALDAFLAMVGSLKESDICADK